MPAPDSWAEGRRLLRSSGTVMRRLVDADPLLDPAAVFDGWGCGLWTALLRQVIDQHISNRAALAIVNRLTRHHSGRLPTAEEFLQATTATLTAVGFSRAKISTLREVATLVADGKLSSARLAALPDDTARAELTAVKGIGRFTADGVLILALGRRDVMPAADLQVRKAVARQWCHELPAIRAVDVLARSWAPWRTLAGAYLYRAA